MTIQSEGKAFATLPTLKNAWMDSSLSYETTVIFSILIFKISNSKTELPIVGQVN